MKKILCVALSLFLCCGLAATSLARYTDIEYLTAAAKKNTDTEIFCRAVLSAHDFEDLEIEVVVTDEDGEEIDSRSVSDYESLLAMSEYIEVPGSGVYTCEFFYYCGADSPSVVRTVTV